MHHERMLNNLDNTHRPGISVFSPPNCCDNFAIFLNLSFTDLRPYDRATHKNLIVGIAIIMWKGVLISTHVPMQIYLDKSPS